MQIQQLKYLLAAAEHGSFRSAAQSLYISQSSISVAMHDLEQELGVVVFERTSRGIRLTSDGAEVVERARSIVEQIEAMESLYGRKRGTENGARFAVSSQHYSLVVDAFGDFVAAHAQGSCEFALRESYTNEIIRDVHNRRSDVGIVYLSNYNDRVVSRALADAGLEFASLYVARPHVIVRTGHPLAALESVAPDDLGRFPRFEQEQGLESSSYFAEEPLATISGAGKLIVSDNGTLSTLLERTDGYALGTGAFSGGERFVSVLIETDETMDVGFIRPKGIEPGELEREFLSLLCARIQAFEGPIAPSPYVLEAAGLNTPLP